MPIFRNKDLYVVGGGDSAVEEALFLTRYASKVYLVHRRDELRASKIMAFRAENHLKLKILWDSVVPKSKATTSYARRHPKCKNQARTKTRRWGLFFAVGHVPNTAFLQGQLDLTTTGISK